MSLGVLAKSLFEPDVTFESYLRLWPFLFVFLIVYKLIGLYSIVALTPAREFRLGAGASAVLFLLLAAVTVSIRGAQHLFTWTLLLALGLSAALLPALRALTRKLFAATQWWGYPAVIFGAGPAGSRLVRAMLDDAGIGLRPVALIDGHSRHRRLHGVPVFRNFADAGLLLDRSVSYAVFAVNDLPASGRHKLVDRYSEFFSHILMVIEFGGVGNALRTSKNLGGIIGLELSRRSGGQRTGPGGDDLWLSAGASAGAGSRRMGTHASETPAAGVRWR